MRRILTAAALAAALTPQLASAQDMDEMRQGLSMLELNVERILDQHGVEADPMSLSLAQIAKIISADGDQDGGDGRLSASQLRTIIN